MNKLLPLVAFSILLLVPVGTQNVSAHLCLLHPGCTTGNLYVLDNFETVRQYDGAGNLIAADFASGLSFPRSIAFDSAGNLYVLDLNFETVRQYDGAGNLIDPDFITNLFISKSITFDSAGNLYVTSAGNNRVEQYDDAGNIINQNFITGLNFPISIAFDSAGNLYVADALQTVRQYDGAGNIIDPDFAPGVVNPIRIAFDFTLLPIGGKIVPIDSAALLLAGAQMNAAWMIPVIVSGIGFAIVILRKL